MPIYPFNLLVSLVLWLVIILLNQRILSLFLISVDSRSGFTSLKRILGQEVLKKGCRVIIFANIRCSSTATLLLSMGVPLKVVQELLGHSSIDITANIYSHVLPSVHKDAMDKMGNFLDGSSGEEVGEVRQ